MNWDKLKSLIDVELFAMISPTLLIAVFIPNVLINPWIVIVVYSTVIFLYLFCVCSIKKMPKKQTKRYFILNSIPASIFCIFLLIMKLWVLAGI